MPDFSFPYHITRSPLGLIFSNYEYVYSALSNDIIEQTLIEATQKINHQLASKPTLANQALDGEWVHVQEKHGKRPKMPGPTFPYRITPDKPLGLIFTHYDYLSTFDNDIIEQTFTEAAHQIDQEIAHNPVLANQTIDNA
ncbi:MAG: hypothetical protein Q9225_004479 [Loekoesia sp. 1 TL-2023]